MVSRLAWFIVLVFCLSQFAVALSVTPSVRDVDYVPGRAGSISFDVVGSNEIEVELANPLFWQGSKLNTPATQQCSGGCTVVVDYVMGETAVDGYGKQRLDITITEEADAFTAGVGAQAAVKSYIRTFIPYPGKYLSALVESPVAEPKVGDPVPIVVAVTNQGGETVQAASGTLAIKGMGALSYTTSLPLSQVGPIAPDESSDLTALWETTGLEPGRYLLSASVDYDGAIEPAKGQLSGYHLGDKIVKVLKVAPLSLQAGGVRKVVFDVRNFWGETFSVYVQHKVKGGAGNVLTEGDSSPVDVGKGPGTTTSFVDLTDVSPGEYVFETIAHYAGLTHSSEFTLTVTEEKGQPVVSEETMEGESSEKETDNTLLIVIIVAIAAVLITLIVVLFLRKRGSNSEEVTNSDSEDF